VVRGRILDIAVDVRRGSPTYGGFVCAELSADNGHQLYVPGGFAHGFCTLSDEAEVVYKVSAHYAPDCEGGLHWDDPELGIPWPVSASQAVVSDRDARLPKLKELRSPFDYDGAPLEPLAALSDASSLGR
jgi:dTDP-4-dehydrorhamnose 3,5-epimerase